MILSRKERSASQSLQQDFQKESRERLFSPPHRGLWRRKIRMCRRYHESPEQKMIQKEKQSRMRLQKSKKRKCGQAQNPSRWQPQVKTKTMTGAFLLFCGGSSRFSFKFVVYSL